MLVWITILGFVGVAVLTPIGRDRSLVNPYANEDNSRTEALGGSTGHQNLSPKIVVHLAKDRSIYARRASGIEGVISDVYEVFVGPTNYTSNQIRGATAVITPTNGIQNGPSGYVSFQQAGAETSVVIGGLIKGLSPNGIHGFSIHEWGNLRGGCDSTLSHFNPYRQPHGGPKSARRHVGDLGNIVSDEKGVANISTQDDVISLRGTSSIIGRAVVIHELQDLMDAKSEEKTGKRLACGVIGITPVGTV